MTFLTWLLLPLSVVDKVLLLLVEVYGKYMYSPMQKFLIPLVAKVPREISVGRNKVTIFTANGVTYTRTSLVVVMALCLKYNYNVTACLLVIANDLLDHLDGIVARAQKQVYGNIDNSSLGTFLDAFCDKVINVVLMWTILILTNLEVLSLYQLLVFVGVSSSVICFELVLGIVRVQDYFKDKYTQTSTESKPTVALAANMEGKTKEKLENIGLSLLSLGMAYSNPMDTWGEKP